ncbi:PREDICTED: uncharacterized protein LOC109116948 [Tarenaya hassleriana]|uniref:uncharacterized protein LOC109116948 n=1 Tax=Tarenaya hassleriana TaxID=28532 RepID=UPI0008FD0DB6|nr:PREDICTED: uncharacterized protein LOC109116948 [Tarenaya hassleriana]
MALTSQTWGYVRIITGTILGGALGFYVMHRVEVNYKRKMEERLKQYEMEMMKKKKEEEEESFGEIREGSM